MIIKFLITTSLLAVVNSQFGFKPPGLNRAPGLSNAPGLSTVSNAAGKIADAASKLTPDQLAKVAQEWNTFKNLHSYATPEEAEKRKGIFTDNWQLVSQHASDIVQGASKFSLKLNSLSDLLLGEFNELFNGYGKPPKRKDAPPPAPAPPKKLAEGALPKSVDWREKGGVTPVKNQNKCAGCYAFSAAGALEGQTFRKTGVLKELSPQNLIDCTKTKYSNWGCLGGYVDESFNYVKDIGINELGAYPFQAKDGECQFDAKGSAASDSGFVLLPEGDEKALAEAVATKGPVSVAIDASQPTMQLYGDGVYYDEKCKNKGDELNHAVLVVGYGEEADGTKYWIVKNSYGEEWGEKGYIKIAKDKGNHCGIATAAYYPIV